MNSILSIIIPVYNTERYLAKCIDSILEQPIDRFEIILINDGSIDNSPEICNEYAKKDKRIKVIHKKNEGVSKARNVGLDICNGEYIMFVDSDDYLKSGILDGLVDKLNTYKPSVLMFGRDKVNSQGKIIESIKFKEKLYRDKEMYDFIEEGIYNSNWGFVTNKIYCREILQKNDVKFNDKIFSSEDLEFNLRIIQFLDGLLCVEEIAYNYLRLDNFGNLNTKNVEKIESLEEFSIALEKLKISIPNIQPRIYSFIIKNYTVNLLTQDIITNNLSYLKKRLYMKKIFYNKNINQYLDYDNKDNNIFKLLSICVQIKMPTLFYIIYKVVLHCKGRGV